MTEAEKRQLALQIMRQEQQRLASTSFHDHRAAYEAETHERIATRQQYYNDFAQQGITFQEFQRAYNDAYEQGRSDMLAYRFSFFYAATAIAYSEIFSATPEAVATFMKALPKAPAGCANHKELVQRCVAETGLDPSFADEKKAEARVTRRDRAAVDRMRKTGISERDLEIEREEGYRDGRMSLSIFPPAMRRWPLCSIISMTVTQRTSNPSWSGWVRSQTRRSAWRIS